MPYKNKKNLFFNFFGAEHSDMHYEVRGYVDQGLIGFWLGLLDMGGREKKYFCFSPKTSDYYNSI